MKLRAVAAPTALTWTPWGSWARGPCPPTPFPRVSQPTSSSSHGPDLTQNLLLDKTLVICAQRGVREAQPLSSAHFPRFLHKTNPDRLAILEKSCRSQWDILITSPRNRAPRDTAPSWRCVSTN